MLIFVSTSRFNPKHPLSRNWLNLTAFSMIALLGLSGQPAFAESSRVQSQDPLTRRIWTVSEALAERQVEKSSDDVHYCQGGRFKPCVCPTDVSALAQYRPAVKECGGKAAVILSGKYLGVFSVVVRDRDNRDRWPTGGFGRCTFFERDVLGLNKCSAFKVQKRLGIEDPVSGDAEVHCLGASGYSPLFSRVTRITAKLSDSPDSNTDPLVRWCLVGPKAPLN